MTSAKKNAKIMTLWRIST